MSMSIGNLYYLIGADDEVLAGDLEKETQNMVNAISSCNAEVQTSYYLDDIEEIIGDNVVKGDILVDTEYCGYREIKKKISKLQKVHSDSIKDVYELMLSYRDKIVDDSKDLFRGSYLNKYYNVFINVFTLYKDVFLADTFKYLFKRLISDITSLDDIKNKINIFCNDAFERIGDLEERNNRIVLENRNKIKSIKDAVHGLEISGLMLSDYEVSCGILSARLYKQEILSNSDILANKDLKISRINSAYEYLRGELKSLRDILLKDDNILVLEMRKLIYRYFVISVIMYYLHKELKYII